MTEAEQKVERTRFFLRPVYIKFGKFFRVGVIACFLLLSVGILLTIYCDRAHYTSLNSTVCRAMNGQLVESPAFPRRWEEFSKTPFNPNVVLMFGIGMLILLPVVRMWAALVYFLSERDYLYACMTAVVVTGITMSLFLMRLR